MKRILIVLFILITMSGCMKATEFDSNDVDVLLDKLLKNNTSLINTSSNGYKYYLPSGVELINSNDYNDELYYNGDYYYLYVDLVSYYYDEAEDYVENSDLFYSKNISYNNKSGHLEIEDLKDGTYRVEFSFNYSKIEAYVREDNLKQSVINMCYILNSIKFNESVSSIEIGDITEKSSEETYDFYTPRIEGNFVQYNNEYGNYVEETLDDTNNIGNEESE
mgnify:CR=1 FL=1